MQVIDNVNMRLGDDLKAQIKEGDRLKIVSAYFSIYAFESLKEELQKIDSVEFIFNLPSFVPESATDRIKKERREFFIPRLERERSVYGSEFEIELRNKLTQKAIAQECAKWIREKAVFKSNTGKTAIPPFIYIERSGEHLVYSPVTGFTTVDLGYQKGDSYFNIITKITGNNNTLQFLDRFKSIWKDPEALTDVTTNLIEHIESVYQENSPERVYFLILYNIFNEFLEDISEDVLPNDRTGYKDSQIWKKLFHFQRDAATGIINKLETYSGCILADSVGLGKTFTALAVIKYYELRNKSVLVLCPKKLADNWQAYNKNYTTNIFFQDRFNYDVLCHTDLQRDSGESLGMKLNQVNWGNYDLVVIDESHNFRNNAAYLERETRYQRLLRQVIQSGVKTKVLMLSATPVNNRFADLRNQLAIAYEGDPENLNRLLKTEKGVEEILNKAQIAFNQWSKLPPLERTPENIQRALDFDFFELLDSVTIARSRKHIQAFYDTTEIGEFPDRLPPIAVHWKLTERKDVLDFNAIYEILSQLKLGIYAPLSYILPSRLVSYEELYDTVVHEGSSTLKQSDRERSLQALMVVNLLKRLESSVHSFRLTLDKLHKAHNATLERIRRFKESHIDNDIEGVSASIHFMDEDGEDLPEDESRRIGGKVKVKLEDMDLESWSRVLLDDRDLIERLLVEMQKVSPPDDSKLNQLYSQIEEKIQNPLNTGNRKIIIFTAFSDTARYLFDNLSHRIYEKYSLFSAVVTGDGAWSNLKSDKPRKRGFDYSDILTLFSPVSKERKLLLPDVKGDIDILFATDCISEGQNLQDCDYLINFDIHWNPVRIIQRFGRIDRIGSKNRVIQMVNYWPDISLDEYINLKERVENRMVIVDMTATGDDNVLRNESGEIEYRKEQLRRLQSEVIELEDIKTGVAITDLGLNEFRMDLLQYMKANDDIARMPNGLHAVIPADSRKGILPGVIFVLRNKNNRININNHNRLHPYYLVYISDDGTVLAGQREVKKILDLIRISSRGLSTPVNGLYQKFNTMTRDGRRMEKYSDLLDQAILSIIESKNESDVDSLFSGSRTTALLDRISGLDDFELVAFLVIMDSKKEGSAV